MKTERELFEVWFESEYLSCKISELIDPDDYWFPIIEFSWETWQASANREGFVLVPVETIRECLSWCDVAKWDSPSKLRDEEIHKHEGVILEVLNENQN